VVNAQFECDRARILAEHDHAKSLFNDRLLGSYSITYQNVGAKLKDFMTETAQDFTEFMKTNESVFPTIQTDEQLKATYTPFLSKSRTRIKQSHFAFIDK
jgi:hypothetical protein